MKNLRRKSGFLIVLALCFAAIICGCQTSRSPEEDLPFTIYFTVNGEVLDTVTTKGNCLISFPNYTPPEGSVALGWFEEDGELPFTEESLLFGKLTRDITLHMRLQTNRYQVTFAAEKGEYVSGDLSQLIDHAQAAIAPVFTRFGYDLSWDLDISSIKSNATVNAVWSLKPQYKLPAGEGTEASPYVLSGSEDLLLLSECVAAIDGYSTGKYFKMDDDIDLEGAEFTPIGQSAERAFSGVFNGDGHKVFNLSQSLREEDWWDVIPDDTYISVFGLFGHVCGGEIRNLTVEDFDIDIIGARTYAGAIAGVVENGKITSCAAVNGSITIYSFAGEANTGGVVGRSINSELSLSFTFGCETDVKAVGSVMAGGFAGHVNGGTVNDCYAVAKISAISNTTVFAGGFVGVMSGTTDIRDCYCAGELNVTLTPSVYVGGFIGRRAGDSGILNCLTLTNVYVQSNISAGNVAAFIGRFEGSFIENSYFYEGNVLSRNSDFDDDDFYSAPCTLAQLNSANFYTQTLKWSQAIWDFSVLDIESGEFPKLKTA